MKGNLIIIKSEEDPSGRDSANPNVEVVLKSGGNLISSKRQEEERPETPSLYGEIEIGLKRVKNLGDCNSGQIQVSLRLPVLPKRESVEKMADWLTRYLKNRLRKELDEMEDEGWNWPKEK